MSNRKTEDRRISPRFDARIDGRLKCSRGTRQPVEITDISLDGCNVAIGPQDVAQGRGYGIKIGGLETLGAELRWIGGTEAGLQFDRPLHPAVLDHIVRENPPPGEESPRELDAAVD